MTVEQTAETQQSLLPANELQRVLESTPLAQQLEALLIIADRPFSVTELATAVAKPQHAVAASLRALQEDYENTGRGFELREVGGGWRFYVRAEFDPLIADFTQNSGSARLSQAALETLAVIAYKQPISRGSVAAIRAVNVDSVVRTLVARGLIEEVGNDSETGAILYGTTAALLEHLGINDISELPPIAPLLDDGSEGFEHE
ncbi:SMC-Scp complex subunit ScpB [Leucobacter sp. OH1287]|uniref:SMC-Scp complex subunit ScpB n=1 Tax=Leucobacter sp. OH1287 TaxID=2491049 RepID=UPI000F6044F1|nr:SMC-Scp complex subunit ScpB [Leucobacter sp. OH1287]RRD61341.1 SMC-Scp complex subunit ScpB [Leucobacter sp. OH1287]